MLAFNPALRRQRKCTYGKASQESSPPYVSGLQSPGLSLGFPHVGYFKTWVEGPLGVEGGKTWGKGPGPFQVLRRGRCVCSLTLAVLP